MTAQRRICELCGEQFDLLPKKPGRSTICPVCSGPAPLLPKEARVAHLQRRDDNVEALFRNAIAEGNREEIEKWDKLRKTPFTRTKNSN